jgi:hypothetical protein
VLLRPLGHLSVNFSLLRPFWRADISRDEKIIQFNFLSDYLDGYDRTVRRWVVRWQPKPLLIICCFLADFFLFLS